MKINLPLIMPVAFSPPLLGFISPSVFATILIPFFAKSLNIFWLMCAMSLSMLLIIQEYLFDISLIRESARIVIPMLALLAGPISIKTIKHMEFLVIFLLILDFFIRIINVPSLLFHLPLSSSVYLSKSLGTIFFIDSNITGMFAAFLFFGIASKNNIMLKLILLICIYYSFSVTSYLVFFVLLIFRKINLKNPTLLRFLIIGSFISLLSLISFIAPFISELASGHSKIAIANRGLTFLASSNVSLFFGIGSGEFKTDFIYAAHNLVGFLSELGVLGFLIIISPILFFMKSKSLIVRSEAAALYIGGTLGLYPIAYLAWIYLRWISLSSVANYKKFN